MTDGDLEKLVAEFVSQSLPRDRWNHAAHLTVGAWHVHRFGAEEAIVRLRSGIRALNDRHGTPNTPTSGYHETITVAYARLIDRFLGAFPPGAALAQRVSQLLTGPLADRAFLLRFWSRETLMSEAARSKWVAPDLQALAWPATA